MLLDTTNRGSPEDVETALQTNSFTPIELFSRLIASIRKGDRTLVILILENGAEPNQIVPDEWCSIHCAIEHRHSSIVKLLHEYGADINLRDESGSTPLHVAVDLESDSGWQSGNTPPTTLTSELIDLGADPNIKNGDGKDAFEIAMEYDNHAAIKLMSG